LRRAGGPLASRGQELESLVDSIDLRSRFFSWPGLSGRRYVCSVFQSGEEAFVAGVESGVVIGVAKDGATVRPVCVFQAEEGRAWRSLREFSQELGVVEWHVHFCADAETARDIAGSLLS
jgi:hypothetical protein